MVYDLGLAVLDKGCHENHVVLLIRRPVLLPGWVRNRHLKFIKKAEKNFCEEDSLFYSNSEKRYQQNWPLDLEENILSFW
ncbi:hypothetical protein AV530_005703 [Patagioenas fasciata monilis]|uniref:Uncharacterized protein n=1 Tax=Patagioenas fasciata monilis TaxID=372326 RepID=A0A1V4JMA5_PATFA|nr:hypothetical protein AV530_005703 [Patagioenas fasciata monilis]